MENFEGLIAEALALPFSGWGFSFLQGRRVENSSPKRLSPFSLETIAISSKHANPWGIELFNCFNSPLPLTSFSRTL
jgi:hypothetical protein